VTQELNIQYGSPVDTHQNEAHIIIEGRNQNAYIQGLKFTFLGRHQLATEIFFSVAIWKNVVTKVSIKFFPRSETQTKIFGRQMENSARQFFFLESERRERIWGRNDGDFSANDKIKYKHADYLYTYH